MRFTWCDRLQSALSQPGLWGECLGVAALAAVLGVSFNGYNPVGLRFGTTPPESVGTVANTGSAVGTLESGPSETDGPPQLPSAKSIPGKPAQPKGILGWEQAEPRLNLGKLVVVDTRSAKAFDAAHVPRALSLPGDAGEDEWQAFLARVRTDQAVLLYGAEAPTPELEQLRRRLREEFGFALVQLSPDGYAGWTRHKESRGVQPTPVTWVAVAAAGEVVLVDSRPRAQFDAGHIPGAIWLPEGSSEAQFAEFRQQHASHQRIVVYCNGAGCLSSRKLAARLMKTQGFSQVQYLAGGYPEWQRAQVRSTESNPKAASPAGPASPESEKP